MNKLSIETAKKTVGYYLFNVHEMNDVCRSLEACLASDVIPQEYIKDTKALYGKTVNALMDLMNLPPVDEETPRLDVFEFNLDEIASMFVSAVMACQMGLAIDSGLRSRLFEAAVNLRIQAIKNENTTS